MFSLKAVVRSNSKHKYKTIDVTRDLGRSPNFRYSGSRQLSNTFGPPNCGCYLEMKCVSNGCTSPNTNPKSLTTLTLSLTLRPSRPFKDIFVRKSKPEKLCQRTRYVLKFVSNKITISLLIVGLIPTLYDVNPTLANVYDAFEKIVGVVRIRTLKP